MSDKTILKDEHITGGSTLRKIDRNLSLNYGGKDGEKEGKPLGIYGKYLEPVFHSMEHTRRAIVDKNPKEWARAKDKFKATGKGLNHTEKEYQNKD